MAAQEYFWYLRESDPEPSSYALSIPLEIVGPLDRDRMQRAVEAAINEREVFRAAFCEVDGRVFQVVDPGAPRFELELVDDAADVPSTVSDLARQLDLATGVLVRGHLQQLSPKRHILVLVLHHAVSDGRTDAARGQPV